MCGVTLIVIDMNRMLFKGEKIMEWLKWSICFSPASILAAGWVLSRKIKISYRISLKAWFGVNIVVFYFSLALMLVTTQLIMSANGIKNQNSMGVQFIQQGGIVTIVMLLSSWMNKMLVQSADLDYTKGYSSIYTKIHFSLICAAAAFVCYLDGKSVEGISSTQLQYGQAVMWLVVISQIWIGFGSFSTSRLDKKSPCDRLKNLKDNFKYAYPCLISILMGPISFVILLYCILIKGLQVPQWVDTISYIFVFEAIVFIMVIFIVVIYRMPARWYDVYRTNKKIATLNEKKCIKGYYSGIKYQVCVCEEGCKVTIEKLDIEIDKRNKLTKKERKELESLRIAQIENMEIDSSKIIDFLEHKAEEKKNILGKARNNIQRRYIKKIIDF